MGKSIQPIQSHTSRNRLLQQLKCGKKMLQALEDIAAELVSDFRENLPSDRVVGVRLSDGSIECRRHRTGQISPYQAWVLSELVKLKRKLGSLEKTYDRAFAIRHKLSFEAYMK